MNYSGSLYELVRSLTKTEKRYFKLFARLNREESNLLKVFDAISIRDLNSDKEVKAYLGDQFFIRHYDVYKVHLQRIILQSMRSFHQNRNKQNAVYTGITDANFLFQKGLFFQCRKVIKKTKRLAYETGYYSSLIELLDLEKSLLEISQNILVKEREFNKLFLEESDVIKKLNNEAQFKNRSVRIRINTNKFELSRTDKTYFELSRSVQHPLMEEAAAITPGSKRLLLQAMVEYNIALYKYSEAKEFNLRYIASYEITKTDIRESAEEYINALNVQVSLCIHLKQINEAIIWNEKLQNVTLLLNKIQRRSPKIVQQIKTGNILNKLRIYLYCGDIKKSADLIPYAELLLQQSESDTEIISEIYVLVLYYHFMHNKPAKILELQKLYKNKISLVKNRDNTITVALISLLINYKKRGSTLLPSRLRSLYRTLLRTKGIFRFEQIIIDFIRSGSKSPITSQTQHNNIEQKLLQELLLLATDPVEKNGIIKFDLISWLESRQNKKAFAVVIFNKYGEFIK